MSQYFDSIDHMMELGLSMAVARQMMQTMNECMASTTVPSVQQPQVQPQVPMPTPQQKKFYFAIDGAQAGPFEPSELEALVKKGHLGFDTLTWHLGLSGWMRAKDVPEVSKVILLNQ